MKIYWIRAEAPRRVLALVKHLRLQAEFVEAVNGLMKTAAYAALNPNMKAPTMVDGDVVLWESSAIMAYLCTKHGSDMWPASNPAEQVEVLRWLSWSDNHWSAVIGPFYFEHVVKRTFGLGEPDCESLVEKVPEVARYGQVLNEHLRGRHFVACDRLTIADFQLASMATDWRAAEMPLQDFPEILRWLDRLNALPAWANPWPQNGSGRPRGVSSLV